MRLRSFVGALVALFLLSTPSFAQGTSAFWDMPLVAPETVGDASSYTYSLKIDAAAAVPLAGVVCTLVNATKATCSAPLSPAQASTIATGRHTLVLTASNSFGSAGSAPLTGQVPGVPGGIRIQITVTIGNDDSTYEN